ncbi:MAG: Dabb family protein [Bacteroidales bacterium]|nr:Dabb family protein [Bacteroidales bacterium]
MKNQKRRSFISMIMKGAAATGLLSVQKASGAASSETKHQLDVYFVHHVFFWLKEPENKDIRDVFLHNLTTFLKQCETINSTHIGIPANTPREVVDNTYTFSLIVTFDSKEAQDAYQVHPAHLKFIEDASHLWTRVQVYDILKI